MCLPALIAPLLGGDEPARVSVFGGSGGPLNGLLVMTVAVLAESMLVGDVAILSGPPGSTVIPGWQLFPATAVTGAGDRSVIGFDRRFQGEEMLAGAIRSLRTGRMPRVVVVHAEDRSMLRSRDDGLEVASIADANRVGSCEAAIASATARTASYTGDIAGQRGS